ncbi:hypothetical protein GCM10008015_29770 [Flavobacterium palustre]|uniref:Uncharacterized protein n=1 Tax=Flavobacterium palustre TaxID=1476463 RepID=A0ABQ1HT45_9FLAO|nr:hypothetical protein GCM10008015_29770 [Flavobacterium palustre]
MIRIIKSEIIMLIGIIPMAPVAHLIPLFVMANITVIKLIKVKISCIKKLKIQITI